MVLASGLFTAMFALVKALGPAFPFVEGVFFRGLFGLPMVLVLMRRAGVSPRVGRPALMLLRGVLGMSAMGAYFYATQRGVLAEVWIVSRFQPVVVALLAPALLGERATGSVARVVAVSMVGVFMVVRPGPEFFNAPALVALLAAFLSATAHMCVRKLRTTEPPMRIVLWFTVIVLVGSGLVSLPVFVQPTPRELLLLLAIAVAATAGQLAMTTAYSRDTAPVVSASAYSGVVFALIWGYLFWREVPDAWSLAGGAVIIGAGLYLILKRGRGRPAPPE